MTTYACILPPVPAIAAALRQLSDAALTREDYAAMRAYDNAASDVARGMTALVSDDTWLVPSTTRAGLVHRVQLVGGVWSCNCEHGLKRGGLCRHLAQVEGISQAWENAGDDLADGADRYAEAVAAMDELYA